MEKSEKKMLTPAEVSFLYSIPLGSLANWRSFKRGPRYFKVRKKVLYRLGDCEAFFTSCPVLTRDSIEDNR